MVSHQQGWPGWFPAVLGVDLLALFIQPTLLVMALYIAAIRFIPAVLLNRQGLLFLFFFVIALAGGSALDTIRGAYNQNSALSGGFPSAWVASLLPLMQGGSGLEASRQAIMTQSGRVVGLTLCLLAVAWVLYRYAFLEQLERFGVRLSASEGQGVEPRLDRLIYALAAPRLGSPVAAIIIKDLRSSRRDSAQRIAFTALAAVIFALVVVDLLTGRRTANVFLLIFFAYALFLVSCQGLSTFSAEGGVLENLARFPLTAKQILWAKILSHFVLFAGVILLAMGLVAIAPSPIPAWFRVPVAGIGAPLLLPFGLFLSWITVTLGAIFPKPGEGGGRKEISIFAMGMFFQLTLLLLITIPLSLLVPIAFGLPYIGIPLLVLVGWLSVLKILQLLAERSVGRALGAEMRSG
jgi:hypothetical protein